MEWFSYGLISALFFSVYYVLLKRNLNHRRALDYIFIYVSLLAAIALFLYNKVNFDLDLGTYILLYLDSWMLLGFFITLTLAYKHLEVSEIAPLSNLTTALTAFIGVFAFSEYLISKNILGIILVVGGAYILEVGVKLTKIKKLLSHLRNRYIKIVFISSVFAALSIALDKIILKPEVIGLSMAPADVFTLHFFTRIFCFVNMLGIMMIGKVSVAGVKQGLKKSGIAILIATVAYTFGNLAYYKALSMQYASLVVPLLAVSSLATTVIAGEMFHEHKLKQKIIAAAIMIIGVYLTAT